MVVAKDQRYGTWVSSLNYELDKTKQQLKETQAKLDKAVEALGITSDCLKDCIYEIKEAGLYLDTSFDEKTLHTAKQFLKEIKDA